MSLPRVATIQDLSGIGRCSLTAAIPILSSMGVQACPLPTAVLSNQTAFDSYASTSLTGHLACTIAEWKKQGRRFDAVSTGFIMNARQVQLVGGFLDHAKESESLIVVDPVMGDSGELYPMYDETMVDALRALIGKADVITPNLTEACLLTGDEYPGDFDSSDDAATISKAVEDIAAKLCTLGPHTAIITGIQGGDIIYTVANESRVQEISCVGNKRIGGNFSGTGDILSAIVTGSLLRGDDIAAALELAGKLFEKAIKLSAKENTDPREGIAFERFLHLLHK